MEISAERLREIFERTDGKCHLCGIRLARVNYGKHGAKAAWEVDHSNPKAKGGSDKLSNLLPACTSCNRSKGARSSKSVRARNGLAKKPISTNQRKQDEKDSKTASGAIAGALIGSPLGLPAALVGAVIGAVVGSSWE